MQEIVVPNEPMSDLPCAAASTFPGTRAAAKATPWRPSSILLTIAGVLIGGIGGYFLLIRPPLLPEDIRFMQLTTAEYAIVGPRLGSWLTWVFRVLGGYALATGIMAVALATTGFRTRRVVAVAAVLLAGASSIGVMVFANFALDSDFKWVLAGVAAVWVLSLVSFLAEGRTGER